MRNVLLRAQMLGLVVLIANVSDDDILLYLRPARSRDAAFVLWIASCFDETGTHLRGYPRMIRRGSHDAPNPAKVIAEAKVIADG